MLIVQHMPPFFTASLATFLTKKTGLDVREATDGEAVHNDVIYIAPGGKHMEISIPNGSDNLVIKTNENPPVNSCRPAVDVLFKSVADKFKGSILSIILTGMGEDGADGVEYLKRKSNCHSIAQDEQSSVVYGMPRAIAERSLADEIIPLDGIASRVSELILKRKVV
jgi:two-component system chemotaxis response regulator CheB